ncbi:2-succinyl-6-hydroxy-2,4-cyclohexadiene-1-carboxylate synthase [Bacteroidota bacterium]
MKFKSDTVNINFEYFNSFDRKKKSVVMIHGFTGSLEDWRDISVNLTNNFNYIGIDLVGHGKSDSPVVENRYTQQSIVKMIDDLLNHLSIEKAVLLGYSMGGRVALCYAVEHSQKLGGLVLESTSAGIANAIARKKRTEEDEELAKYIETEGLEKFVDLWVGKQIFNTQLRFSNEKLKALKKKRLLNTATGLANSLRGFGTGKMGNISILFNSIQCPVLLVTGSLDTKFTGLNAQLKQKLKSAEHKIIKNAGHNTHLEETKKFVDAVNKFLSKI